MCYSLKQTNSYNCSISRRVAIIIKSYNYLISRRVATCNLSSRCKDCKVIHVPKAAYLFHRIKIYLVKLWITGYELYKEVQYRYHGFICSLGKFINYVENKFGVPLSWWSIVFPDMGKMRKDAWMTDYFRVTPTFWNIMSSRSQSRMRVYACEIAALRNRIR